MFDSAASILFDLIPSHTVRMNVQFYDALEIQFLHVTVDRPDQLFAGDRISRMVGEIGILFHCAIPPKFMIMQ